MQNPVLLRPEQRWECPNCDLTDVTNKVPPPGQSVTHFHACPGLGGLKAPMVAAGVRCKVVAVEREDYERNEKGLRYLDGKPIMSVRTVRDDGEDCAVFAPVAIVSLSGGM